MRTRSSLFSPYLLLFRKEIQDSPSWGWDESQDKIFLNEMTVLSFTFKMYVLDTNLMPKISNWNLYPSKRARWNAPLFSRCCIFLRCSLGMFSPSIFLLFFPSLPSLFLIGLLLHCLKVKKMFF